MPRSNWENFGGFSIGEATSDGTSLATRVLDSFNIPHSGNVFGGNLSGIDIKRMDAMQVIQASLFEELVNGRLCELVSNDDGGVEIITVGEDVANITDVYYEADSFSYKSEVGGVMVTGGAPPSKRSMGSWESILTSKYNAKVWDDAHYLSSACTMPEMRKYCTITYDDPHLNPQWDDGIARSSRLDLSSPFESIVSYQYMVRRGDRSEDVEISFNNRANVPLDGGSSLGVLLVPELTPDEFTGHSDDCTLGLGTNIDSYNIKISVPRELATSVLRNTIINKVSSINGVYLIGKQVEYWIVPSDASNAIELPTKENTVVMVDFSNSNDVVTKLSEGVNYVAGYLKNTNEIGVSFVDRSVYAIAGVTGLFGDNKTVHITAANPVARLHGKRVWTGNNILPIDENNAIIVNRILVSISVDTPCIDIVDPEGNAGEVARNLTYDIRPIKVTSKPAVVSYNGGTVNLEAGVGDNDPTETFSFEDTPYENVVADMAEGGGGMSFTLSSLNQSQANVLSGTLYDLYRESSGTTKVYTCGPDLNINNLYPGQRGLSGGIIDKIEARYTDSNSYLITITEGDIISSAKFSSLNGTQYIKKNEDVSATGIVTQDHGNGSEFKVLVDGIGYRTAINTCSEVISVGDRVQVNIRNNPVES
jgi:hypothetical protein